MTWRINPINKYNAKKARCRLEHTHDSGIEAEYCAILQLRKRAGEIADFQYAREFKLRIGDEVFIHKPDFTILGPGTKSGQAVFGPVEIYEVKGLEKMEWRLKRALFRVLYPDIPYWTLKKIRGMWIRK